MFCSVISGTAVFLHVPFQHSLFHLQRRQQKSSIVVPTSRRIWRRCDIASICWDCTVIIRRRFCVSSLHESLKACTIQPVFFREYDLFFLFQFRFSLVTTTKIQAPNRVLTLLQWVVGFPEKKLFGSDVEIERFILFSDAFFVRN